MYRIVSVSRNLGLLLSRNDALGVAGYSVVSPRVPEQTPLLVKDSAVDAVVIGHSVEPEKRTAIIRDVRSLRPGLPVIFVYTGPEIHTEPGADMAVDVRDGPEALIVALQERLLPRAALPHSE
jgi:hypothetical protein